LFTDHDKTQTARMVKALATVNDDALPAAFSERYPDEWRRAAMIPGLRKLMTGWLLAPDPDPAGRVQQAAIILGHGRALTDVQWLEWAQVSFALVLEDTIKLVR
jgi:hypothetical protein